MRAAGALLARSLTSTCRGAGAPLAGAYKTAPRVERGASLRVQANLFERVVRVVKSYANALGERRRGQAALWPHLSAGL